ncbi:hypothetical protein [Epilithonimonas mollis]|uniref:Uncharacterized protein n=1 Tax=Epilithonimonas mollis TaxID=216903 RepID=A0A1M6PNM0_9FLAO|nr:hypothetical protein [Epilithonimonas mollis]SHK09594.1 hypothetical protein SAMN05444371_1216 [Epilithonimonas mollis]
MKIREFIISLDIMSSSLEIINSTEYTVTGKVSYMTIFFGNHPFFVAPNKIWVSRKHRIFPLIEISAIVKTPRGNFKAKSSITFGTYHQLYEIVQVRENRFRIRRKKPPIV